MRQEHIKNKKWASLLINNNRYKKCTTWSKLKHCRRLPPDLSNSSHEDNLLKSARRCHKDDEHICKGNQGYLETGSARGTRKTNLIWEKNGYNVDSPSILFFRPTQGVYIYHLKLVNSIVPQALVGGILVKPVNPAWKITFFFHILKGVHGCNVIGPVYLCDLVWAESRMEFEILFFNIRSSLYGKRDCPRP